MSSTGLQKRRRGTYPAIVVDQAEARNHRDARIRNLGAERHAENLAQAFGHILEATRRPGLPCRQPPAVGVQGRSPSIVNVVPRMKSATRPFGQKPRSSICIATITG